LNCEEIDEKHRADRLPDVEESYDFNAELEQQVITSKDIGAATSRRIKRLHLTISRSCEAFSNQAVEDLGSS